MTKPAGGRRVGWQKQYLRRSEGSSAAEAAGSQRINGMRGRVGVGMSACWSNTPASPSDMRQVIPGNPPASRRSLRTNSSRWPRPPLSASYVAAPAPAHIGSRSNSGSPRGARSRGISASFRRPREGARRIPQPIRRRTRVKCWHADSLASLPEIVRGELIRSLTPDQAISILHDWSFWARPNQLPPAGEWRVWALLAGRGFGKTRTGAELVRARAASGAARRISFVAPTAADVRDVMVEGESGILTISPPRERPRVTSRRNGGSPGRTARSRRCSAPMSPSGCEVRSTILPGATSWPHGGIPRHGTC